MNCVRSYMTAFMPSDAIQTQHRQELKFLSEYKDPIIEKRDLDLRRKTARRYCVSTCLLHNLLDVEVVRSPKRASLKKRRQDEIPCGVPHPKLNEYLMNIISVRNGQRVGEPPVLIHKVELITRQKQN